MSVCKLGEKPPKSHIFATGNDANVHAASAWEPYWELRASTTMPEDVCHGRKLHETKHFPLRERIETHMKRLEANIRRLFVDSLLSHYSPVLFGMGTGPESMASYVLTRSHTFSHVFIRFLTSRVCLSSRFV